jgi:hypothetical protein
VTDGVEMEVPGTVTEGTVTDGTLASGTGTFVPGELLAGGAGDEGATVGAS